MPQERNLYRQQIFELKNILHYLYETFIDLRPLSKSRDRCFLLDLRPIFKVKTIAKTYT